MSQVIQPTVGRVVWAYFGPVREQPMAALIVHVYNERMVNLAAFDANGVYFPATNVPLVQPGDEAPEDAPFCTWMPYQVKKSYGSESGEEAAGKEEI